MSSSFEENDKILFAVVDYTDDRHNQRCDFFSSIFFSLKLLNIVSTDYHSMKTSFALFL